MDCYRPAYRSAFRGDDDAPLPAPQRYEEYEDHARRAQPRRRASPPPRSASPPRREHPRRRSRSPERMQRTVPQQPAPAAQPAAPLVAQAPPQQPGLAALVALAAQQKQDMAQLAATFHQQMQQLSMSFQQQMQQLAVQQNAAFALMAAQVQLQQLQPADVHGQLAQQPQREPERPPAPQPMQQAIHQPEHQPELEKTQVQQPAALLAQPHQQAQQAAPSASQAVQPHDGHSEQQLSSNSVAPALVPLQQPSAGAAPPLQAVQAQVARTPLVVQPSQCDKQAVELQLAADHGALQKTADMAPPREKPRPRPVAEPRETVETSQPRPKPRAQAIAEPSGSKGATLQEPGECSVRLVLGHPDGHDDCI